MRVLYDRKKQKVKEVEEVKEVKNAESRLKPTRSN
jgi:hypothetical protein